MKTVKLDEVIQRCQTREDRYDTDLEYYVGGEHFESGQVELSGRGKIAGSTIGPMFYYGFKPGDFLLVSRNPHLRKAARVDFAGICSEKTFVLETKDPELLLPDFLPWVLQNERFWTYAQANRHGSTNFFINWSTLAEYEFPLPGIDKQKEISEILWAAQRVRDCYRLMLKASDDLVKSQFVEIFGYSKSANTTPLRNCCKSIQTGKTPSMKHPEYYGGDIPFIKSGDVKEDHVSAGALWLTEEALEKASVKLIPSNSVLVVVRSALLRRKVCTAISDNVLAINQDIKALVPKEQFSSQYLLWAIRAHEQELLQTVHSVSTTGMDQETLFGIPVKLASKEQQKEFTTFVDQVDKSKFALQKSLDDLDAMTKKLMNEELGLGNV